MTRLTLLIAVTVALAGCEARAPSLPRPVDPKRASVKELQTATAISGVAAGAKAGQEMLSAPVTTTSSPDQPVVTKTVVREIFDVVDKPKPRTAIHLTKIKSDKPQPTYDRALNDAVQVAQIEIAKQLQKLDPPVTAKPSLAKIKSEYVKWETVNEEKPTAEDQAGWKAGGIDPNREWVTFDVELTDGQIQSLRSGDRVNDGIRGAGVLFAVVAAIYGFLRLDAYTKGYLTTWLAIGAMIAAGVAAIALLDMIP